MRASSLPLALLFFAAILVASPQALAQPAPPPGGDSPAPHAAAEPAPGAAPSPPPNLGPPPSPADDSLPQDAVLEAVEALRALPLADVILRNGITDQVIAATLFPVNDRLVYRLTLLSLAGQLSVMVFYADTGAPFEES